jgi:hypothetical protein
MTREELEETNRKLRKQIHACNEQIKDYERRIAANIMVKQNLTAQINANTEKFIQLGKDKN